MIVKSTNIPDVKIIEPLIFNDSRGYFFESFSAQKFNVLVGYDVNFVQDNESKSAFGVVRGLHYQLDPYCQAKLVRVVKGKVLDVAVDIRKNSPTFGHHVAVELSEENKLQLFIPRGFAHGFAVLSTQAVFQYKCDNYYNAQNSCIIAYNDPLININWQLQDNDIVMSDKDKNAPLLKNAPLF